MPRCSAYQSRRPAACSARWNTPPIPVTRSMFAMLRTIARRRRGRAGSVQIGFGALRRDRRRLAERASNRRPSAPNASLPSPTRTRSRPSRARPSIARPDGGPSASSWIASPARRSRGHRRQRDRGERSLERGARPGDDVTSNRPSSAPSRSAIPCSPVPLRLALGSKPRPSSVTVNRDALAAIGQRDDDLATPRRTSPRSAAPRGTRSRRRPRRLAGSDRRRPPGASTGRPLLRPCASSAAGRPLSASSGG